MKIKGKVLLGIIFIIILVLAFLPEKGKFFYAADVDPDSEINYDWYPINYLSIFSVENNEMIEVDLKNDVRDKITELMKSAIESEKTIKPLINSNLIAEQGV